MSWNAFNNINCPHLQSRRLKILADFVKELIGLTTAFFKDPGNKEKLADRSNIEICARLERIQNLIVRTKELIREVR